MVKAILADMKNVVRSTEKYEAARSIAKVKYENADHHKVLGQFGWLSVLNLIKLDMGIFIYKCQNSFMPDSTSGLYTTVDNIHSYHWIWEI